MLPGARAETLSVEAATWSLSAGEAEKGILGVCLAGQGEVLDEPPAMETCPRSWKCSRG